MTSTCGIKKYSPLEKHLQMSGKKTVSLSFSEIEEIIGAKLPPSAYKYAAWWGNTANERRSQTTAWMNAGYKAQADLSANRVDFST